MLRFLLLFLSFHLFGAEFIASESTVEKIFARKREESPSVPARGFECGVGQLTLSRFSLANRYFLVDYAQRGKALAYGFARVDHALWEDTEAWMRTEYSREQGIYRTSGVRAFRDALDLEGFALSTGVAKNWGRYLSFDLGAGLSFFSQRGYLDGMSQNFLLPFFSLGGRALLYEPNENVKIRLGAFLKRSMLSEQKLSGVGSEISWNWLL